MKAPDSFDLRPETGHEEPAYTLEELLTGAIGSAPGAEGDDRPSNLHGETDWGPPVGREVW